MKTMFDEAKEEDETTCPICLRLKARIAALRKSLKALELKMIMEGKA